MRKIIRNNKLIAVVIDSFLEEGTKPLTEESLPLQIIALKHPRGKKLVPHSHSPLERITSSLSECLLVMEGKIKVDLYDKKEIIETIFLSSGEGILLINAGIGIEIIENAKMLEFKNGPFLEDKIVLE